MNFMNIAWTDLNKMPYTEAKYYKDEYMNLVKERKRKYKGA